MKLKDHLKREKIRAKQYLKQWAQTGSYCPVLKRHVHITRLVWDHTILQKPRSKEEMISRLKIFPKAKRLVEKCKQIHEERKVKGIRYYALEDARSKIRVVITQKENQKLTLFSIIALSENSTKKEAS